MGSNNTYSRKEISKILSKASEIQKQKDLYGDRDGLTEQELIQLAKEVGIDSSSLLEALQTYDEPEFEKNFNWIKGNSSVQTALKLDGEIDDSTWNKVVQEIRKETGGIGALSKNNTSFEWEQRRRDIGYKHISLTPGEGATEVQIVNSWRGVKFISTFFACLIGFMMTAVSLKGSALSDFALIMAPFGALLGLIPSRIFLSSYFKKQKQQVENLVSRISKVLKKHQAQPQIVIEEESLYSTESVATDNKNRVDG